MDFKIIFSLFFAMPIRRIITVVMAAICLYMQACTSVDSKKAKPLKLVDKATMRLIRSLLVQDSFLLSSKGSYSKPIVSHLRPVNLITDYPKSNVPALPKTFDITLRQLLYYKYQGIPFFSQRDSLFLIQQHQNQRTGLIDTTLFAADDFFWLQDKENRAWSEEHLDYFRFSLPLFSQDSTKAYIQMDHNCAGGCGGGVAYFLKKEEGTWRKIFAARRWFN